MRLLIVIIGVCWVIAILYIGLYLRAKRIEATRLQLLADLPNHDFFDLCLRVLRDQRHWQMTPMKSKVSSIDYRADDGGKTYLIAIKHRHGYHIGPNAIDDLAAAVRLHEGDCYGVLLTEELVQPSVRQTALAAKIELIDGPLLWNLVKLNVQPEYVEPVVATVRRSTLRQLILVTVLCLSLCLLVLGETKRQSSARQNVQSPPLQSEHVGEDLGLSPPEIQARTKSDAKLDVPTLQEERSAVLHQLLTIPGITHAAWISQTTLAIERNSADDTLWPAICATINRYPDLQITRLQLNPRPNTKEPVHWRQCTHY